jgi:prepilin-type N-terminal cleavage/methylation domain-containing protein
MKAERGFTLIELLIVVAILGVLAAVVIPNVGRFIGRGETEAKDTEFQNIQSAVHAMMVDNELSTLLNPVDTVATNDMSQFPDTSLCEDEKLRDIYGDAFTFLGDKDGYILYGHDRIADGDTVNLTNYVATRTTAYWYTVTADGTITQHDSAP